MAQHLHTGTGGVVSSGSQPYPCFVKLFPVLQGLGSWTPLIEGF